MSSLEVNLIKAKSFYSGSLGRWILAVVWSCDSSSHPKERSLKLSLAGRKVAALRVLDFELNQKFRKCDMENLEI